MTALPQVVTFEEIDRNLAYEAGISDNLANLPRECPGEWRGDLAGRWYAGWDRAERQALRVNRNALPGG